MKKSFGIAAIILCLMISYQVLAQISDGGLPASFGIKNDSQALQSIHFQSPDMIQVNNEDLRNDSLFLPRRFSIMMPVNIDIIKSGTWFQLEDGSRICRLKIFAEGAIANNLYFNNFFLPEGVKLFLYDESNKQLKGAFTNFNNPKSGHFATELMAGETVILELNIPAEIKNDPIIHISEFGYAYRDVPHYDEINGFGGSDWCEVNINCSPEGDDWQTQKRGVVRIMVKVSGSGWWCTGSLINNVRYDATPFVLTADHCAFQLNQYASETDLDQWIFYFNYESATCDNPNTEPELFSMVGASKIAQGGKRGQEGSDFYLVLLNNLVPSGYNPYFMGWSRFNEISSQGVTIQHPEGDIKKISTYITPLESSGWYGNGLQSHWKVIWAQTENNWGVTEAGSSGSPLFDSEGRLIGTLTGGLAACDESGPLGPDKPDYYGKFSYHWQSNGTVDTAQLKPWLDPDDTGIYGLGGYTLDVEDHKIVNNLDINIYPNPANEYFFINFTNLESRTFHVSIYDIVGKLIKETYSQNQGSELKINICVIPKGVYFLTIKYDHKSIVKKLIIQ